MNPVHVLDLVLFLPAIIGTGVLLLRHHPWITRPPPLVAGAQGHPTGWPVVLRVGLLLFAALAVLRRSLRSGGGDST